MAFISWLDSGLLRREEVGGKGAALSELIAGGFRVPRAFAVNVEGFQRYLAATGLADEARRFESNGLGREPPPRSMSAEFQAKVDQALLPPDLEAEIVNAYRELAGAEGPACAVRSSATSEDARGLSFAGIFDSFLNVQGEAAVIDAVRRCYASLWSERVLGYYARQGFLPEAFMAVLVMRLVPAEISGVVFTAHPVTGALDQVIINSTFGLGEAIVSGLVTPDSFLLEKGSLKILEVTTGTKATGVFPVADRGTEEKELEPSVAERPTLTEEQARGIADVACRVEQYMGGPQDIEFAMAGGELYLLQSRPITTL
jgi:phosphoenolpyruvate synthase/pyruvate phosphate dikinase